MLNQTARIDDPSNSDNAVARMITEFLASVAAMQGKKNIPSLVVLGSDSADDDFLCHVSLPSHGKLHEMIEFTVHESIVAHKMDSLGWDFNKMGEQAPQLANLILMASALATAVSYMDEMDQPPRGAGYVRDFFEEIKDKMMAEMDKQPRR